MASSAQGFGEHWKLRKGTGSEWGSLGEGRKGNRGSWLAALSFRVFARFLMGVTLPPSLESPPGLAVSGPIPSSHTGLARGLSPTGAC